MRTNYGIKMTAGSTNFSERSVSNMRSASRAWQLKWLKIVKIILIFFKTFYLHFLDFFSDILDYI